jgi:uncharacterized protein (DUF1015 family)
MSTIRPFRAVRPKPETAAHIAAVPYDVVNADEARALAAGNDLSFLHVSRAEIDLPPGTDPYAPLVYETAARRFAWLRDSMLQETEPAVYFYRLRMGTHVQTGLAACYSVDEYERDIIKKHERTRRDKEDDRTHHIIELGAQTGPVFLTYRASSAVDAIAARVTATPPLYDLVAPDGVGHTLWRVTGDDLAGLIAAFGVIPCLYIADGHHRAASAARARAHALQTTPAGAGGAAVAEAREADWMLAVAFPDNQMQVLPYNRVVKDLAGRTPDAFLAAVGERFAVAPGGPSPARRGQVSMYLGGRWFTVTLNDGHTRGTDPISNLDVAVLQERLLAPLLNIADPRTDKRIDFVGGIRGTAELERLVDSGKAAVAFSMFPVGVDDLMAIADAGQIMPPKSTWFEPKLRDGLVAHLI